MLLKPIHALWRASLLWLALACAVLPPAHAEIKSLIFERAQIRIDPRPVSNTDKEVTLTRPPLSLDVELRGEEALSLEYIHTLNTLDDKNGVMILLTSPAIAALPAMKVYTAVDVLFVAEDGTIVQISPAVVLGELTQTIQAKSPINALLFIKAGTAAARGLRPRDTVAGRMFSPAAPVQE